MELYKNITAADFNNLLPMGSGVLQTELRSYLRDAVRYGLKPVIPASLYTALESLLDERIEGWDRTVTYSSGAKVLRGDTVYISSSSSTGEEPEDTSAKWTVLYVWEAWKQIREYICFKAGEAFFAHNGIKLNPAGMQKVANGSGLENVSDRERANMVAFARSRADIAFSEFLRWIDEDKSYNLDGTEYAFSGTDISDYSSDFNIDTY